MNHIWFLFNLVKLLGTSTSLVEYTYSLKLDNCILNPGNVEINKEVIKKIKYIVLMFAY